MNREQSPSEGFSSSSLNTSSESEQHNEVTGSSNQQHEPLEQLPLMSAAPSNVFNYYRSIEKCRRDAIEILTESKVNFLLKEITNTNRRVHIRKGLDFRFCTTDPEHPSALREIPIGGYFNPIQENITICCDRMANPGALKETMSHEMLHVYDMARFGDLSDCNLRACAEIRAYNLTGTCDNAHKQSQYNYSREECARIHALLSTAPMCGPIQAEHSTKTVLPHCFNDHTPFDPKSQPVNIEKISSKGVFKRTSRYDF
ncbi:hypothetical protein C9374_004760 [Naegleria lovaniensis]|uniref:Mitochondrial inner membrane protease ATP23 n=1 Tax=Naegleria lovaniensis TaxID=51637 RepID=A0AA88GQP9_NAELO|nr:uncharacterized protein C9374_004760 [Naegleria lovaniensis]KAG2382793.1 hypothetical protein C9374_004760 [Naegleria lovaniensis]